MGYTHSTSALSTPLGTWIKPGADSTSGSSQAALGLPPWSEPPRLGTLPKSPRSRVLALSGAVYGTLFSAALALTVAAPTVKAPQRTMTVALETFDVPAPPPPAASPAAMAATSQPAVFAPRIEDHPPEAQPLEPGPTAAAVGSQAAPQGPLGGVPGGQGGGVAGGVLGGQAGGSLEGVVNPVIAPRFDAAYLQNPEPAYPLLSKGLGEEGRVLLRVFVSAEGKPDQVELRQSSGHPRLDQAALATVRRWRFSPARRGQERLAAWVLVPLSFQLDA